MNTYDRVVAEFTKRRQRVTAATATLIAEELDDEDRQEDVAQAVEQHIQRHRPDLYTKQVGKDWMCCERSPVGGIADRPLLARSSSADAMAAGREYVRINGSAFAAERSVTG